MRENQNKNIFIGWILVHAPYWICRNVVDIRCNFFVLQNSSAHLKINYGGSEWHDGIIKWIKFKGPTNKNYTHMWYSNIPPLYYSERQGWEKSGNTCCKQEWESFEMLLKHNFSVRIVLYTNNQSQQEIVCYQLKGTKNWNGMSWKFCKLAVAGILFNIWLFFSLLVPVKPRKWKFLYITPVRPKAIYLVWQCHFFPMPNL